MNSFKLKRDKEGKITYFVYHHIFNSLQLFKKFTGSWNFSCIRKLLVFSCTNVSEKALVNAEIIDSPIKNTHPFQSYFFQKISSNKMTLWYENYCNYVFLLFYFCKKSIIKGDKMGMSIVSIFLRHPGNN